ncbi:MAG TPA: Hsp20/alpha crystallin family protein [Candidatus Angelobacter sp.]|nr:Hsp20/alpha crystallin family protein [Candidatus Angelobacter sp.]
MPLTRLRDQLDRMFDQPDFAMSDLLAGWTPAVDVLEDKDKLTVKAELPGFKREDINVTLHEDSLILSGERRVEEEQKQGEFYRCERYYGKFHRLVSLPSSVDAEKIEAKYQDGVLSITLPKTEKARGKKIEVGGT